MGLLRGDGEHGVPVPEEGARGAAAARGGAGAALRGVPQVHVRGAPLRAVQGRLLLQPVVPGALLMLSLYRFLLSSHVTQHCWSGITSPRTSPISSRSSRQEKDWKHGGHRRRCNDVQQEPSQ